jgi:hypothetical protein
MQISEMYIPPHPSLGPTCLHKYPFQLTKTSSLPLTHHSHLALALSLEGRIIKGKKRREKERRRDLKFKIMPRWRIYISTSPPPSHKCKLRNLTIVILMNKSPV